MKYQELADIIKIDIDNGVYHESGKLPTEDNLIKEYSITRYCVRNAIEILVSMGYIYPVQGSGMFVRESKREGCLSVNSTKGISAEYPDKNIETKVIRLNVIEADEEIAKRMKCKVGTQIYDIVRLRIVDGEYFAVEYNYYNKEIVHYINKEIAEGSLYSYIRNDLGINIGFADKIILADELDKESSELLHLKEGAPALVVMDDAYLSNGQIFDVSKVIYNYKLAKLFNLAVMK